MIDRIVIENFKSLRQVELSLGSLNLFIGTNASGKSNFFDALRLLQGLCHGFTVNEVLDGKPRSDTSEVWDAIRGGSTRACFANAATSSEIGISVAGHLHRNSGDRWEYAVRLLPINGRITQESLTVGDLIFDSAPVSTNSSGAAIRVKCYTGNPGTPLHLEFGRSRSVLSQMARGRGDIRPEHAESALQVARILSNTQRVDPSPAILRGYSQAHHIRRMGEHGENFAALVKTLSEDPATKDAYLAWLRQLRPAEVDDVGVLSGALGEPLFMLTEGGTQFPAQVLSDGTLRFAAIAAAFFQPDMPGILTIEELENGIHAGRVRLLVELLRSRANAGATQIMATTHSPIVLAWLKPEEYRTTFFCKRSEETGESHISPLSEIPHFNEVVKRQPIADLFSEGWLEAAL
jgi:predicted ATPase